MPARDRRQTAAPTVREATDLLAAYVRGPFRRQAVDAILGDGEPTGAFSRLTRAMRGHRWPGAPGGADLAGVIRALDARTRAEGLHVLHGWDFRAQRRPPDIAPVLLARYCEGLTGATEGLRRAIAILVDQYFLQLLMLPAVRAWDDGHPEANLDVVTGLVEALNGPDGSGHATVDDAATLLMLAVAYYHPEEAAYDRQLGRVRSLDREHALQFARACAPIMSGHLRWGLRFMYRNDVGAMRADNVVDYPWSAFALVVLLREYARLAADPTAAEARLRVAESVLDGLSPDPWAFAGKRPAILDPVAAEHDALRGLVAAHREALVTDFEACRLRASGYAPLGFSCNFLSNAVVASAVIAVGGGDVASLNTLFSCMHAGDASDAAGERLATALMRYAASDVGRLGAGGVPLIVYDRRDAAHFHNTVVRTLSER